MFWGLAFLCRNSTDSMPGSVAYGKYASCGFVEDLGHLSTGFSIFEIVGSIACGADFETSILCSVAIDANVEDTGDDAEVGTCARRNDPLLSSSLISPSIIYFTEFSNTASGYPSFLADDIVEVPIYANGLTEQKLLDAEQ